MKIKTKPCMQMTFFVYFVFRSFLSAIYGLPFQIIASCGIVLGRACYNIDRNRHRFIHTDISAVFARKVDGEEREILGRESCEHLAMYIPDLFKLSKIITLENHHHYMEIVGSSHLMKSIQKGNGTIIVTGHFGNFYLFLYLSPLHIPLIAAVIREPDNPYLECFPSSLFSTRGIMLKRIDGTIHAMQQLLRNNAMVVTLADQKAGGNHGLGGMELSSIFSASHTGHI